MIIIIDKKLFLIFVAILYSINFGKIIYENSLASSLVPNHSTEISRRIRVPQYIINPDRALDIVRENKDKTDQEIKEQIEREFGCSLLEFSRTDGDNDSLFLIVVNETEIYQGLINEGTIYQIIAREPSGFLIGGVNSNETIEGLTELTGISIEELEKRMRPGNFSQAGFIGQDESLIQVLKDDNIFVLSQDLIHQKLIADLSGGIRRKQMYLGGQRSVFDDGSRTNVDIYNEKPNSEVTLKYSGLLPNYILRYGFYEGNTIYRLSPEEIMDFEGKEFKFVTAGKRLITGEVLTAEQAEMVNNRIRDYLAMKKAMARIKEVTQTKPLILLDETSAPIIEGFSNDITTRVIQKLEWLECIVEIAKDIYVPIKILFGGMDVSSIISEDTRNFLWRIFRFDFIIRIHLGIENVYNQRLIAPFGMNMFAGTCEFLTEEWLLKTREDFKEAVKPLLQLDYENINELELRGIIDIMQQLNFLGMEIELLPPEPFEGMTDSLSSIENLIHDLKSEVEKLVSGR